MSHYIFTQAWETAITNPILQPETRRLSEERNVPKGHAQNRRNVGKSHLAAFLCNLS